MVVPADMNKPFLLVLDRTALTKQSLAALVGAFKHKPLLTADLSTSMEHRIVVPPRKRRQVDYCVSITTERFPIPWQELAVKGRGSPSVVLEPVGKARLVSLPGRDVPIESVHPQADDPPPTDSYAAEPHPAFVEMTQSSAPVKLGRAGASGRSQRAPRVENDGLYSTYLVGQRPDTGEHQSFRPMFSGTRDEPVQTAALGKLSDCWRNLDPSSRR